MTGLVELITGIQHVGIPTNDIEETVAFYKKLGFFTALRTENAGEKVAFLRLGNVVVEVYQNGQAVGRPGAIDHVALDVMDIERAFTMVRTQDVTILDEEIQFLPFWERGVRFFTVMGPNGEKIEFSQML